MRMRAFFFPDHSIKPFFKQLFLVVKKASQLTLFAPKSIHKHYMGLCERFKKFHLSCTFIQNFKVLYWTSMAVYWFTGYNFRLITKVSQKRKKRRDQKEEKNLENLKRNLFEFLTPKLLRTHHFKFLTIDSNDKLTNLMNLVAIWDVKVLEIVRYNFTNFATKKVRFYLRLALALLSISIA